MPEGETIRFLLVEDDDDHADLIMRSLRRSELPSEVTRVSDGLQALHFLRAEGDFVGRTCPDVVLLDVNMPKVNGHEVLSRIRADANLAHLPVVVLTTSDAEPDRAKAYSLHANSYLVKPLDFQQLRALVDCLSAYWGLWNRPSPSLST